MAENGLLNYRITFSSHKGLQTLYRSYSEYCKESNIQSHISINAFPQL